MLLVSSVGVLLAALWLLGAVALTGGRDSLVSLQNTLLSQVTESQAGECDILSSERIQQLNLTAQELDVLPSICWHDGDLRAMPVIPQQSRGIPEGLSCTTKKW